MMIHFTFRRKKEIRLTLADCERQPIITPLLYQEANCKQVDAIGVEAEVIVVALATSVPQGHPHPPMSCFTFAMTMKIIELELIEYADTFIARGRDKHDFYPRP